MVVALVMAMPALADDAGSVSYGHRGSVGGWVSLGPEFVASSVSVFDQGFRSLIEVGGTVALSDRFGLHAAGRLTPWPRSPAFGVSAGARTQFGYGQLKTFADLDLLVHVDTLTDSNGVAQPLRVAVGPHVSLGLLYDVTQLVGLFASLGGTINFGAGLRGQFELLVGCQFRTFVFD